MRRPSPSSAWVVSRVGLASGNITRREKTKRLSWSWVSDWPLIRTLSCQKCLAAVESWLATIWTLQIWRDFSSLSDCVFVFLFLLLNSSCPPSSFLYFPYFDSRDQPDLTSPAQPDSPDSCLTVSLPVSQKIYFANHLPLLPPPPPSSKLARRKGTKTETGNQSWSIIQIISYRIISYRISSTDEARCSN